MPPIDPLQALMPSVLDRLIDPDSAGTVARRGYGVKQMTDAVRRDLLIEQLLKCRPSQGLADYVGNWATLREHTEKMLIA